jgi:hypothetical protein
MLAKDYFESIKILIENASESSDINILLRGLEDMNLVAVGEINSMLANYTYSTPDGSSIRFHYHSYDPSGPFQNLPDTNKITDYNGFRGARTTM